MQEYHSTNSRKIQLNSGASASSDTMQSQSEAAQCTGQGVGLSTLHISPQRWKFIRLVTYDAYQDPNTGEWVDFQDGVRSVQYPIFQRNLATQVKPKARVWEKGTLVEVKTERIKILGDGGGIGGTRKEVQTFSKASRRRLLRKFATLDKNNLPLFVTLTYPDQFPGEPKRWKRDIDTIGKRFRRRFPHGAFIWRLELQTRKSGDNVGEVAPHFHLLVWGINYDGLLQWLSLAWYGVVGSQDERHLRAGTRVEEMRSQRGTMFYAGKYIAKEDEALLPEGVGRFWGIVGRDNLPESEVVEVALTAREAVRAVRVGRKYMGLAGRSFRNGLTWIMDGQSMLKYFKSVASDE